MEFSRQEYWSRLPFSSPEDLPDPGIEAASLRSPALAGGFFTTSATLEAPKIIAALFTIAKVWKQPKCPSTDEWIKKMCSYNVIKMLLETNDIL